MTIGWRGGYPICGVVGHFISNLSHIYGHLVPYRVYRVAFEEITMKKCGVCGKERPWYAFNLSDECTYCTRAGRPRRNSGNPASAHGVVVGMGTTATALDPIKLSTLKQCEACGEVVLIGEMEVHLRTHSRQKDKEWRKVFSKREVE